jgi:glycosyltransferase involved in cell wall biosynthesis
VRVLWVCNIVPLPAIADDLGVAMPVVGGWMTGLAEVLTQHEEVSLSICFPLVGIKDVVSGRVGEIDYFAFPAIRRVPFLDVVDERRVSQGLTDAVRRIVRDARPDMLHIFGTEYAHALVASQSFGRPERTLINIQGLTSVYARHFLGTLPRRVSRRWALSNLVRGNLVQQLRRLEARGQQELMTLSSAGHFLGRTDWDHAATAQINPGATYHYCPPALRRGFYGPIWKREAIEEHSIVFVQGSSPVKGLYYLIEALPEIVRRFPKTHVYVVGNDPTAANSIYARLKRSSYGSYLDELMRERGVRSRVTFLGSQSEDQVRDRMLHSHVFVSASTIENESNALCEARILGLPSVASFVGGVTSIVRHVHDAFAYQADAPYMLAHYVCELFARPELCEQFSERSRASALEMHDRQAIGGRQVEIYRAVMGR